MSLLNSMFLVDLKVQDLSSYIECKEFYIRCQFANIFNVYLKDPNEIDTLLPEKKSNIIQKVWETSKIKKPLYKHKTKQSILFECSINSLKEHIKYFPIELSLWSKDDPDNKIGSTRIPWSPVYYEYLEKQTEKDDLRPAFVSGGYDIFDEITSKRMAIIRLNVKLTFIKDTTSLSFQALFKNRQNCPRYSEFYSKDTTLVSTRLEDKTGVIKTSYSGGKRKVKQLRKSKKKIHCNNQVKQEHKTDSVNLKDDFDNEEDHNNDKELLSETGLSFTSLKVKKSRSDADLNKIQRFEVKRSISQCTLNQDRFNMLKYIYGSNGAFESKVYCVGYFTVENDNTPTPSVKSEKDKPSPTLSVKSDSKSSPRPSLKSDKSKSSPRASLKSEKAQTSTTVSFPSLKSEKVQNSPRVPSPSYNSDKAPSSEKTLSSKEKYKLRICTSGCLSETHGDAFDYDSLDLPEAAAQLITQKKCPHIDCNQRIFNEPPTPPDDRVLLDLTHLYDHECEHKKVEEISGTVQSKGKVEMNDGSCFCTCECTFGFVKKTTYCTVCGGFEKVEEDFSTKPPNMPFPCPIYHKIQKTKSPRSEKNEPEKDSKKKKKMKDDRFKFNYGYTAPHIGHSHCASPCSGTMGPVPKNMGWLWTAENIPGMKVAQGWKPGAINKQLLRKLNKAKILQSTGENAIRTRKNKKQVENKPTLIICKRNGEYIIEMQSTSENDNCNPLIYKIAKETNIKKVRARSRKEKRLIKEAIEEVWSDPYRPEVCDAVCYKAYQRILGIYPGDPLFEERRPETKVYSTSSPSESCSCDYDNLSTDSSLDIDWELHFTPPIYCTHNSKLET